MCVLSYHPCAPDCVIYGTVWLFSIAAGRMARRLPISRTRVRRASNSTPRMSSNTISSTTTNSTGLSRTTMSIRSSRVTHRLLLVKERDEEQDELFVETTS
eukprot:GHVQ01028073.1.p1 GENE.GHVQ01028073.1~~GHVQ01028073.1.p1  ORF type:complete len:101 (+),score=6.26 GHVQ01028073.1:289-591(+)